MDFIDQPTEFALTSWRFGSPEAERLVASLLHSEGARAIDPQSPLGGPDGLKDVILDLNGWKYIAAVYFPTTLKMFADVRKKFQHDLRGVKKNKAEGIAFFTNQRLTPTEREKLESLAKAQRAKVILYHVEAIRAMLDSPRGYGMRLQYLRIPMKPEEQMSFIAQFGLGLESALEQQSSLLDEIVSKMRVIYARLGGGMDASGNIRLDNGSLPHAMPVVTVATRTLFGELVEPSDKTRLTGKTSFLTQHLDLDLLLYIHRVAMDGSSHPELTGALRSVGVWLGVLGSSPNTARYVPPPPDEIPNLTASLLASWRGEYDRLLAAPIEERFDAIVTFHFELLRIHPFLDGNGRVARLILEQQARELLGIDRRVVLEDSAAYYAALTQAEQSNFSELRRILSQAMFGTWEPEF